MPKIEVLVFQGCPHADAALAQARLAIAAAGVPSEVHLVFVEDDAEAQRLRFLGSPTVRVDGIDVEESARNQQTYGKQCRIYLMDGVKSGIPPVDWIVRAIRDQARAHS